MSLKKPEKNYLTPKEVAKLLMVSTAAIRLWAENGDLKARLTKHNEGGSKYTKAYKPWKMETSISSLKPMDLIKCLLSPVREIVDIKIKDMLIG